jgi:hypothetical protein
MTNDWIIDDGHNALMPSWSSLPLIPQKDKVLRVIHNLDVRDTKVVCTVRQLLRPNTSNTSCTAYRVNSTSTTADHLIDREC